MNKKNYKKLFENIFLRFVKNKYKMDNHNFYDYLQNIFTSTDDDLLVVFDSDCDIANIDFQVTYIDFNEERQKIQDFTESSAHLDVYKHIDAKKVNLDKINSCMDELFPRNNETKEIFGSLDMIRKIKKRYSSLQRKNDRINQLEDFFTDKVKNYLVDNINEYIGRLNVADERDQEISQIKKKCYGLRFNDKVQQKSFLIDSNDDMTLYENPFVDIK